MAKLVSPKTWVLDLLSVPYQFCVLRYLIYRSHDGDGGDDDGGSRDNGMLMVTLVVVGMAVRVGDDGDVDGGVR